MHPYSIREAGFNCEQAEGFSPLRMDEPVPDNTTVVCFTWPLLQMYSFSLRDRALSSVYSWHKVLNDQRELSDKTHRQKEKINI